MIANSIALLTNFVVCLPTLFAFILAQDGEGQPAQPRTPLQQLLEGPWILIIGLVMIWYITMIAPERKRRADEQDLLASLKKNDRVITVGGIHGTIVSVSQDSGVVTLRVDENSNTRIKVNKTAIASVVDPNKEKQSKTDKESYSNAKD